jgi:hypothetical protein
MKTNVHNNKEEVVMREKIRRLNQSVNEASQSRTMRFVPQHILCSVFYRVALRLTVLTLLTACTARDVALENALTEKLEQFKHSNALSMDLNDVLGKNWRKICVQGAFTHEEYFNKYSEEQVNKLLDISENELAVWVFYNDGSIEAAILKRNLLDFLVSTSKDGNPNICTSTKYPCIYTHQRLRKFFYFKD